MEFVMPTWLYTAGPNGLWIFLLLTVILGGGGAFISGKSIAETWRPWWQVPVYMILLALGVRFMHFALFEEVFLSLGNFIVDYGVLLGLSLAGYRLARARQMANQYSAISR
jgi:hypothetical protein